MLPPYWMACAPNREWYERIEFSIWSNLLWFRVSLTCNRARGHRKIMSVVDDRRCLRAYSPDDRCTHHRRSIRTIRNLYATNLCRATVNRETLFSVPQNTTALECNKTNWLHVQLDHGLDSHKSVVAAEICNEIKRKIMLRPRRTKEKPMAKIDSKSMSSNGQTIELRTTIDKIINWLFWISRLRKITAVAINCAVLWYYASRFLLDMNWICVNQLKLINANQFTIAGRSIIFISRAYAAHTTDRRPHNNRYDKQCNNFHK